jgi:drug/metabolite transporter (DMT)-like permease
MSNESPAQRNAAITVGISKGVVGLCVVLAALIGATSGNWSMLLVCAPFAVLLIPGYWNLLPQPSIKPHWTGGAQKFLLLVPLILLSNFLCQFLMQGLTGALRATALMLLYFILGAGLSYVVIKRRHNL